MKKSGIFTYGIDTKAKGLQILCLSKADVGWLILGSTDTDLNLNDSTRIKLAIYKDKPDYTDKELPGKIKNPNNPTRVVGGFYILPFYSVGRAEWQLCGIVVKASSNFIVASIPQKPVMNIPEPQKKLNPINQKPPEVLDDKKTKNKKSGKNK